MENTRDTYLEILERGLSEVTFLQSLKEETMVLAMESEEGVFQAEEAVQMPWGWKLNCVFMELNDETVWKQVSPRKGITQREAGREARGGCKVLQFTF